MSRNITEFLNGRSESVKLKAEKIELALTDDLKSGANKLLKQEQNALKRVGSIRSEISRLQGDIAEIQTTIKDGQDLIVKFKRLSKELGVPEPKELSTFLRLLSDAESKYKQWLNDYNI